MLFNSYEFIFLYLPVVLLGFFWLSHISNAFAALWLALASLFFYGYWNPAYVGLLLCSVIFNFTFGLWIAKQKDAGQGRRKKQLLVISVSANLILLAYYKYANFFVDNINNLAAMQWNVGEIILPLGISFFTFTQIAFLVDVYQGKAKEFNFIQYLLFVTYFPHLIAGPVLHHKEMMPQFSNAGIYRFSYENMAVGLTIFFIGLFKKVVLADGVGAYVGPVFDAPGNGVQLTFFDAWGGALCYTMQLYFDFSGYSDMAIGLSRMFGVILPVNFHSPYKSVNIIEFWRRWHMTLSRFLRDYLYIPLGGNRKGEFVRLRNLMITMLLGGLWHGAGWTFIVWGGLHGFYLVINQGWQKMRRALGQDTQRGLSSPMHVFSVLLTFIAVTAAWVVFRADSLDTAFTILKAMSGLNGVEWHSTNDLIHPATRNRLLICMIIAWAAPNTQQIMHKFRPALGVPTGAGAVRMEWDFRYRWILLYACVAIFGLMSISELNEFIYFQF